MKPFLKYAIVCLSLMLTASLSSQNIIYRLGDTSQNDTIVNRVTILDSSLVNRDIFELLGASDYFGSQIEIDQRPDVKQKLNNYIANASKRVISGYRIRIFFSNNQQARAKSEQLVNSFSQLYSGIGVYRTYDNPYFKVTVGDLRTKSDAVKMLKKLESEYPSAFIVRENINFPPL